MLTLALFAFGEVIISYSTVASEFINVANGLCTWFISTVDRRIVAVVVNVVVVVVVQAREGGNFTGGKHTCILTFAICFSLTFSWYNGNMPYMLTPEGTARYFASDH